MEQYENIEKIDQGELQRCFHGNESVVISQYVAMKKLRKEQRGGDFPSKATREINILGALDHKNIIKRNGRFVDVLVYRRQHFPYIEPNLIKSFMYQILDNISYFHSKRILLRDLKPKNILIDLSSKTLKLADFGIATRLENSDQPLTQEVLTQWLHIRRDRDTEILFMGNSEIDQLVKIFSLLKTPSKETWTGIDLLPGSRVPFVNFPPKVCHRVSRQQFIIGLIVTESCLLKRLLCLDPECRITATDALQHGYFGIPYSSSSSSRRLSQ